MYYLPVIVTLSTGEKITFKERFTHKMQKAIFRAVNNGVSWKQNVETGEYEKDVPAENIEFQYEAVFPLIVERIEKDGKDALYSAEWLDEVLQTDYRALEDAVARIRNGDTTTDEEGKKNTKEGR